VTDPAVEPGSAGARRAATRRQSAVRLVLVAVWLAIVFGLILPQVVDYGDMVAAFAAAPPLGILVVALIGVGGWLFEGLALVALLPGLRVRQGVSQWLAVQAVGNTIPGPLDWALGYRMLAVWGIGSALAALAITLNTLLMTVSRLVFPTLAVFILTALDRIPGWGWLVAVLLMLPVALGSAIGAWILRSEAFARRVGAFATRATGSVLRRIHRPDPGDLTDRLLSFRRAARGLLRRRAIPAVVTQVGARTIWLICLVASLRVVGVPAELIPWDVILAVYAFVLAFTLVPLSPGGAGIPELIYIWAFTSYVGDPSWDSAIAAGVMLMRAFQWFIPIPAGYAALAIHLRRHPETLRAVQADVEAEDEPVIA